MTFLAAIWNGAKSKLGYALLTAALAGLKVSHPDWPLPSAEQLLAGGAALIACHTVTDIFATVASIVAEVFAAKRAHVDTGLSVPAPIPGQK